MVENKEPTFLPAQCARLLSHLELLLPETSSPAPLSEQGHHTNTEETKPSVDIMNSTPTVPLGEQLAVHDVDGLTFHQTDGCLAAHTRPQ